MNENSPGSIGETLLTVPEAAELLGIKPYSMQKLVYDGKIRVFTGENLKTWMFTRSDVERRIAERNANNKAKKPPRPIGGYPVGFIPR